MSHSQQRARKYIRQACSNSHKKSFYAPQLCREPIRAEAQEHYEQD